MGMRANVTDEYCCLPVDQETQQQRGTGIPGADNQLRPHDVWCVIAATLCTTTSCVVERGGLRENIIFVECTVAKVNTIIDPNGSTCVISLVGHAPSSRTIRSGPGSQSARMTLSEKLVVNQSRNSGYEFHRPFLLARLQAANHFFLRFPECMTVGGALCDSHALSNGWGYGPFTHLMGGPNTCVDTSVGTSAASVANAEFTCVG